MSLLGQLIIVMTVKGRRSKSYTLDAENLFYPTRLCCLPRPSLRRDGRDCGIPLNFRVSSLHIVAKMHIVQTPPCWGDLM